jgi:hypothetical protein
MNPLAAIVAPFLFVPVAVLPGAVSGTGKAMPETGLTAEAPLPGRDLQAIDGAPVISIIATLGRDTAQQVSIEQRIIVRITPLSPSQQRAGVLADLPQRSVSPKFEEKSMGKCLPVAGIGGVQIARDNHLVLFMRDSRIVRAGLDKGCTAQDFYSGFYVQRTGDGMMCSGRDKLQSRNGANCKLGKLKQLVPAD